MIAEIIINSNARALNRIFDYIVPEEFEKEIKIGARVFVPFGNSKKLEDGFVIGLKESSEFANKPIINPIKVYFLFILILPYLVYHLYILFCQIFLIQLKIYILFFIFRYKKNESHF